MSFLRVYDMAFLTYLLAFGHFFSELYIFRTSKFGAPVLGPVVVSSKCSYIILSRITNISHIATTLVWMFNQYDFYIKP